MKKIISALVLVLLVIYPQKVQAADCSYAEQNRLNGLANNIKADFVVESETRYYIAGVEEGDIKVPYDYKYFVINIYNMTSDFYFKISNDTNLDKNTYAFKDAKDGTVSFRGIDPYIVTEYTIDVYTASSICGDKLIRTFKFTVPMINTLTDYGICSEIPEFYLCQPYLNFKPDMTDSQFLQKANDYLQDKIEQEEDARENEKTNLFGQIIDFVVKYWYFFVGGVAIIGISSTIIVIIRIRRRVI